MIEPNDYTPLFAEETQPQQRYVTYIPYGFTPETYEERKKVRKIANTTGAALLVVLGISEIIGKVFRFLVNLFFDLTNKNTQAFFSDSSLDKICNAFFSILVFTVPFIIAFKISGIRISGLIRFRLPKFKEALPYVFLGVGFCAVANITVSYMGSFFSMFGVEYNVDYGDNPTGFFGFMLTFISTAIIPPLTEEFAFRGIVLGSLKKYGNAFAIITSAIIFGVIHGNFQQMPFAFLVGLVLGFVTVKTGSIWTAVIIHAFNNAFSVIHDYIFMGLPQIIKSAGFIVFLIISLIIGIVGVGLLADKDKAFSIKGKNPKAATAKIFGWFFTSPTIIIFIVLSVLKAFKFFV